MRTPEGSKKSYNSLDKGDCLPSNFWREHVCANCIHGEVMGWRQPAFLHGIFNDWQRCQRCSRPEARAFSAHQHARLLGMRTLAAV